MDYLDFVQERLETREQELKKMRLVSEARRLGAVAPQGPFASLDALIIRASKGAKARQARREYSNHQELVS